MSNKKKRKTNTIKIPYEFADTILDSGLQREFAFWLKLKTLHKHTIIYTGYSCLLKIVFSHNGGAGRSVIIRQHHGWGGGSRTRGANITKYERDIGKWDADIFLYGHVHQKQFDRVPRLGMRGLKLIARHQLMVLCGSYLKTYSETEDPTYAEIKGFPPVEIGGVTIKIKPDSNRWVHLSAEL